MFLSQGRSVKAVAKESAWGQGVVHNFIHRRFYSVARWILCLSGKSNISWTCEHSVFDDSIFDDFPEISDQLLKISEDSPKLVERSHEFCEHFLKISEDYRRLPTTFEGKAKLFRWYTNEYKYNLRDTWYEWNHQFIFTSEEMDDTWVADVVLYEFYEWCIFQQNTPVFIIKARIV